MLKVLNPATRVVPLPTFGSVALPAKWEKAGEFAKDLCPVKLAGKWGLVDLSGKLVRKPT